MTIKNLSNLGIDGDYKHLDSTPQGDHKPASVMTLEATVDATPQALKPIRPFFALTGSIPATLTPEAQITMQAMFACFDNKKEVKEGLIGDLMFGFAECGIPPMLTIKGLEALNKAGYIKFQAPDNTYVDINSDHITKSWVRYERKLLDLVYGG